MVSSICTSCEHRPHSQLGRPLTAMAVYVVFHHYTIWDRSKTTFYILLGCFVATFIPATYFGIKSVFDYRGESRSHGRLRRDRELCSSGHRLPPDG